MTAAEFMTALASDSDYQERKGLRDRARAARHADHLATYEPESARVLSDLTGAGFDLKRISDLNRAGHYAEAIPVLIHWVPLVSNRPLREELIRVISVPWGGRQAAELLLSEMKKPGDARLKWAIANGLAVVADDAVYRDVVALIADKTVGKPREMLTLALGNMKNPAAVDILVRLLEDDIVVGHALMALRKLKAVAARPLIERLVEHKKAWVRTEARKALGAIDRAEAKRHPPK